VNRAIQALGLTESQFAELKRLLPTRKIEAVKRYREITNFGLAEAKAAIEAMEAGAVPGGGPPIGSRPGLSPKRQAAATALQGHPKATPGQARSIRALAALLPRGSRSPTPAEAVAICELAAAGAVDEATLRIGASWGVDTEAAREIAVRLGPRRRRSPMATLLFAAGLLLGAAWFLLR
jgi:hypothetical protein